MLLNFLSITTKISEIIMGSSLVFVLSSVNATDNKDSCMDVPPQKFESNEFKNQGHSCKKVQSLPLDVLNMFAPPQPVTAMWFKFKS